MVRGFLYRLKEKLLYVEVGLAEHGNDTMLLAFFTIILK